MQGGPQSAAKECKGSPPTGSQLVKAKEAHLLAPNSQRKPTYWLPTRKGSPPLTGGRSGPWFFVLALLGWLRLHGCQCGVGWVGVGCGGAGLGPGPGSLQAIGCCRHLASGPGFLLSTCCQPLLTSGPWLGSGGAKDCLTLPLPPSFPRGVKGEVVRATVLTSHSHSHSDEPHGTSIPSMILVHSSPAPAHPHTNDDDPRMRQLNPAPSDHRAAERRKKEARWCSAARCWDWRLEKAQLVSDSP
jgi:hypothetical protein